MVVPDDVQEKTAETSVGQIEENREEAIAIVDEAFGKKTGHTGVG